MDILEQIKLAWMLREASKTDEEKRYYDGVMDGISTCYRAMTGDEIKFNPIAEDGENPFYIVKKEL